MKKLKKNINYNFYLKMFDYYEIKRVGVQTYSNACMHIHDNVCTLSSTCVMNSKYDLIFFGSVAMQLSVITQLNKY